MSEPDVRVHACLTPGGRTTHDRHSGAVTVPLDIYADGLLIGEGPLVMSTTEVEHLLPHLAADVLGEPLSSAQHHHDRNQPRTTEEEAHDG
jgi:hypothetical protein